MKAKRILGSIILIGYFFSQLLSYLGYVNWNQVAAADNNKNTTTQLVAVLVNDQIYPSIEKELKRYATEYIQKKYPLSKAVVLKINSKEYSAPEITKLLENLYFDGIKDQSSRLIGLVLVGEIPLPVMKYNDYIFPSIYPYVDFLEQKYLWNDEVGYFLNTRDEGQAEVWHGIIDFGKETESYQSFFSKLKSYETDPKSFVDKKIWYDDFVALKNNFLTENFAAYQNKLLFAEDLGYHRYTNFLVNFLEGKQNADNKAIFEELSSALTELNTNNDDLNASLENLKNQKGNTTPTKLLEQKLKSFLKDYYELLSTPLTHTISENVKASDRREVSEGHQQKIQINDQILLGDRTTDGIIKSINDKLEAYVDKKVEQEKYAMKSTIPTFYRISQNEGKRILGNKYYIPKIHDSFQFFYFGKDAQTINKAEDFSILRGSYRNLTGFTNYSNIINDRYNPAKTTEEKTDLYNKGLGASYDLFSTQIEANRGFNIFNMEEEYQLYEKEKTHAEVKTHCVRRRFGLKWKWVPCAKVKWAPVGKCNPSSKKQKDHADCEDFEQFGKRVWGGATPLNIDAEKTQNQIYEFKGPYDPKSAWKWIFDIAGSVASKTADYDGTNFLSSKIYSSPTKISRKEGKLKDAIDHSLKIDDVWYFNVNLTGKQFIPENTNNFKLYKQKLHIEDTEEIFKYKIVDSRVEHKSPTQKQINGYSGSKEQEEAEGYYLMIKDNFGNLTNSPTTGFINNIKSINQNLIQLKNDFESAANSNNPNQIRELLSPEKMERLTNLALTGIGENRENFNTVLGQEYATNISITLESIILRQIKQKEKIGILNSHYTEILGDFGKLKNFLNEQYQNGIVIFETFKNSISALETLHNIASQGIANHQGTGNDEQIKTAWNSIKTKLGEIDHSLQNLNQESSCHGNLKTLGLLLDKKAEINFIDKSFTCPNTSGEEAEERTTIKQTLLELENTKTEFNSRFSPFSATDFQEKIPGMNILTPDRPIDSPRYLSFQGVGENVIQLIYPNLFKVEMYENHQLKNTLSTNNQVKEALIKYLKDKVQEYNTILETEKGKAKMNEHYLKLLSVDKLATPILDESIRPYKPFTYEEILEALGGEKMLNSLAELLYYQNVSNQIKNAKDNIEDDIKETRKNLNINEKINYIIKNYLSQNNDQFLKNQKNTHAQLIIPNYNSKGYEVGYINSDENDYITTEETNIDINSKVGPTKNKQKYEEILEDAEEVQSIEKECGFDINEALLLYNFKTQEFDWRNGVKCRLKEVGKKPFELKLSFEGSLGAVPIKETVKNDIIDPLKTTLEDYQQEVKQSIGFHEIKIDQNIDPKIQEIFNQTQISIQNKKINILTKTGAITLLSLKDFGDINFQITSTGENCLIINNQNSCKTQVQLTKNPFKNGIEIPFSLAENNIGNIALNLEICNAGKKCGNKIFQLSAVPGPIESFDIELPQDKKILAGAYTLLSISAFDKYRNKVQRSLEPYIVEVDKGQIIIGENGYTKQEVNDFQNLKLLYRAKENENGAVKISIKDKNGKLFATSTAQLVGGNLSLDKNNSPITTINYTIADEKRTYTDTLGNEQINTKRLIPITITLKDKANRIIPMTTNLIMGAEKGLTKFFISQENKNEQKKKTIKIQQTNSLIIKEGKTTLYLDPGYHAGEEVLNFTIPGLPPQKLKMNIIPGALNNIKINIKENSLEKNSSANGTITLHDAWGNQLKNPTSISIEKRGNIELFPLGTLNIKNGEQAFKLKTNDKGGLSQIFVSTQSSLGKIETSQNIITKEFFLKSAINSGLNIMYLNLFGSDRGNQRSYGTSSNKKFSENIINKSEKTLAVTTQLIDPKKIKRASLILGENAKLENTDNLEITANISSNSIKLAINTLGSLTIQEGIKKIYAFHETDNTKLNLFLEKEKKLSEKDKESKILIYNINSDFNFKKGNFFTKEGTSLGKVGNDIILKRTPQTENGFPVWELICKGQILGSAILTQVNFGNTSDPIENKDFELGTIFSNGSTNNVSKAIFDKNKSLNESYIGYDSIQNSHEMDKYIGFRGNFKNITSFAGGKSVGEATLPFGSEFLINIGDPLLKRIEKNQNTKNTNYNQGLGKIIYNDPEKPIFKTLDIDYNNDGLRDILVVYKDGTIKLQKQYQDKSFQDMGTLMISAEEIKEIFIGDVDGNSFEDIIIRNGKDQLRIYTNNDGIFDVDGQIACLNTNVKLNEITDKPESLSGAYQIFLKDMNVDGKLDIITFDKQGYLKIFYGDGKKNNHSYMSKDSYGCDNDRYKRQKNTTKIVKKFGLNLNSKKAIRDESLIRWDGLTYPTEEAMRQYLEAKNNREKGIETDPLLLKKIEDPGLKATCYTLDYQCERNSYGEQFCKKQWRYNTCKPGCSAPAWPSAGEAVCKERYREMDRTNDDQRIRGKASYEDGMCWLPPVASCVKDGYEENGRIDETSKNEIVHAGGSLDVVNTAQAGIGIFDKYVKNPFLDIEEFEKHEEWAFIPINKLETPSRKTLGDQIRDVSKRYTDLNGGNLENGDIVQVEVVIINKYATFGSGSAFFDKISGPWIIEQDEATQAPKNIKFKEGSAKVNPKTGEYAYYLNNIKFSANNELVYTYTITYKMEDPLFKINIDDVDINDFTNQEFEGNAPTGGMNKDGLPDFTIQTANDGCNKNQAILFNTKEKSKKEYREVTIDLQKLSDDFARKLTENKNGATTASENNIKNTKSTETINNMPGIDAIEENYEGSKSSLKTFLEGMKQDGTINIDFFTKELKEVEKNVQDAADKLCNGFSFGLSNIKSCEGLPIPFNQAILAPGNYHLMGCIPMEPLTRTLGKGIPVFHFPGTLHTPVGPIPIPWGQKGPGDSFLRAAGGTYPSRIRIYAAPTLTAQLGLAICFGPQTVGLNLPSPFSDMGGNCIVTSMPLPCGKKNSKDSGSEKTGKTFHAWAANYGATNTCQLNVSDSPFSITASQTNNEAHLTSLPEGSFLGGMININYDSITSNADSEQNGLEINGVKIQGVKDIKNKILGGKQQGLMKVLVGWFDKQTQYWINNLLRFRMEVTFPDMNHLSQQLSSFNQKEIGNLTSEGIENTKEKIDALKTKSLKSLAKNAWNTLQSKEQITKLDLINGDNPFEKLQEFFNDKELVNIRSQNVNVKIPRIYSEDIEAYGNYLKTWKENNEEILNARIKTVSAAYLSCETELKEIRATKGASLLGKEKECKVLQDTKNQLMQMQAKFDKTSQQIFQNVQTLELYKRFPLEIYEWLHVSDRYLGEVSVLLSNFFGYINYRMEINAARFSQYTDAIITIVSVVKTYQIMVDLFVNRGSKCGKCTQDSYDQYTCKLSFLCPDLPIIPIPSVKIPSLYIDLSHLNLGMDIVLPKFNFVPESIELPRLPNLPEPPQLGMNIKVDFNIPDIPQLPEPPSLPELPSFIPQVKMQLPILPPAPKIPELPNKLTKMLTIAKSASKIFCIIKSGIGLVGENSVKARIEQMTQRTYNVPRVDNLNLNFQFKQTPLQGIDIQADSYVNLQYNFDGFYALLKGIVDGINQSTYHLVSSGQNLSDRSSNFLNEKADHLTPISNPIQINVDPIGYHTSEIKNQILDFQNATLTEQEKTKFSPVLALLSTDNTVHKNDNGINRIQSEISKIIDQEHQNITQIAELAKNNYNNFLKLTKTTSTKEPIQLSFSTNLLNKNEQVQEAITKNNPIEILVNTEGERVEGYFNAINTHSAESLNMSTQNYENSKRYLAKIKTKISERKSLQREEYAGLQQLTTTNGTSVKRALLTQSSTKQPEKIQTATTDLSAYINGILIKGHNKDLVNVVHSKFNYEQIPEYYEQDLNNDKKADLIMRDTNNVYVKYADDTESQKNQSFKDYYLITPTLKNTSKKYETLNTSFFRSNQEIKIYDENDEVKNFKLGGQTFDSLNFSWIHNKNNTIDGYLMRISERVDGLLEKNDLDNAKYVLFLPNETDSKGITLSLNNEKEQIEKLLGKGKIYEILYYNPAKDELQFNLHEVPRKWQYFQITSLKLKDKNYTQNAPRSNQLVGGRQIIGDEEAPKPKVELIRSKTSALVDEGFDLEGFIGTYYNIKITRTDNVQVKTASIFTKEKKLIKQSTINAKEGTIIIKETPFRKETEKSYIITANDSEGNETTEEITLTIKTPKISIENIEQHSGRKEGIENPIIISSELETDIDEGDVSFEKERNGKISELSATNQGKQQKVYPVSTNITKVQGAYYDFGELIGLYAKNENPDQQPNKLYATVNGKNGEILIQPAYKKLLTLGVDFSKGNPVVKVLQKEKTLFEILLKAEKLIKKEIHKGTLYPLEGSHYGSFDGGEVLMIGKEPILYIAKNGTLRSNKPLQGKYHFDAQGKFVRYEIFENAFGEPIATITFQTKAL